MSLLPLALFEDIMIACGVRFRLGLFAGESLSSEGAIGIYAYLLWAGQPVQSDERRPFYAKLRSAGRSAGRSMQLFFNLASAPCHCLSLLLTKAAAWRLAALRIHVIVPPLRLRPLALPIAMGGLGLAVLPRADARGLALDAFALDMTRYRFWCASPHNNRSFEITTLAAALLLDACLARLLQCQNAWKTAQRTRDGMME